MRANFAAFANALCHLNATPLSVAVLAPCAWGKNLVARQIQCGKRGENGNSVWAGDFSLSLSLVARTFWHTNFFKYFIFGLLRLFCHFERSDPTGCKAQATAKKSTQIKRKFAILGYFANA